MDNRVTYRTVLMESGFRRLFLAAVISRFGDAVDMIAYGFMVYRMTGSAVLMATLFAVNGIPSFIFNMFSGVLVSYMPKKRVVVLADLGRGLTVTLTALLYFIGALEVWHLYLFTIINSSFEAFRGPASTALLRKTVSKEHMERAVSLDASGRTAAELIGYSAAALLIGLIGASGAILVDGSTFFISAILIAMIHMEREHISKEKFTWHLYIRDMGDGISYIKGQPLISTIVFFAGGMGFLMAPFNALQMPFVLEVMDMGEVGISVLSVCFMVAMILGGLLVPAVAERIGYKHLFVTGGLVIGIGYMLFGFMPFLAKYMTPYAALVTASVVTGSTVSFMNVPIRLALMKRVDEKMIPRMVSLMNIFQLAAVPLGGALSGLLVAYISMEWIFITSGALVCMIFISQHFNHHLEGLNQDHVL